MNKYTLYHVACRVCEAMEGFVINFIFLENLQQLGSYCQPRMSSIKLTASCKEESMSSKLL